MNTLQIDITFPSHLHGRCVRIPCWDALQRPQSALTTPVCPRDVALDMVAFAEHDLAVLPNATSPAGIVEDLEGGVGGALQQVTHAVSVRMKTCVRWGQVWSR